MALIGPMKYLTIGGKTYEIESSGGTVTSITAGTGLSGGVITDSGTISLDTSRALTVSDIQTGTDTANKLISAKTLADVIGSLGGGTVTSVGAQNATNGGLSISGSPVTTSGTITIGHSNILSSAQTTQAVYPIKIDKNGHISGYGDAVTIPTASTTNPLMDGTASYGSGTSYARSNHVHPTDTSRQATLVSGTNIKTINGNSLLGSGDLIIESSDVYYVNMLETVNWAELVAAYEAGNTIIGFAEENTTPFDSKAYYYCIKVENSISLNQQYADFYYPAYPDDISDGYLGYISRWNEETKEWENIDPMLPTIPTETQSATTGISIANHSTGTVIGVQSTTTTASHVKSGGNGSAPTLGTAFSVPNVTAAGSGSFTQGSFNGGSFTQGTDSFTANTPTAINTSKFNGGSFTQGTDSFTKPTHAADSFTPASLQTGFYTAGTATTPAVIDTSKFSGGSYSHSGFNGGSFTRGSFSGGSLSMSMDSTDTKKLNITFTAATHANDSFTAATYGTDNFTAASLASGFYTAGTKGTPTTINTSKFNGGSFTQGTFTQGSFTQGTDSFTAASLQTGFYTAGTAASFTQGEDEFTPATHGADSHTHIAPTLGTKFTIPNVTSVGSASNWVFENVTVPIKNASASTFVTGTTHTITDNGHTHSI